MLRRLPQLLLAVAIAGAPVALELCQIACASLSAPSGARAGAHSHAPHAASCHDAAESPAPLSLHAHACDHGGDLPTPAGVASARHGRFGVSLAAALALTDSVATTPVKSRRWVRLRSVHPSAARADRTLPLRI
jgi:hypothetical protein